MRMKWKIEIEERERELTITQAHDTWMGWRAPTLEPMWYHTSLCVRAVNEKKVTCEVYCLHLLMVISITASLSSKMHNWDSPWEGCVLVGTWSTSLNWSTFCFLSIVGVLVLESKTAPICKCLICSGWTLLLLVERRTSITISQRSRASTPSRRSPAPEKCFQTL